MKTLTTSLNLIDRQTRFLAAVIFAASFLFHLSSVPALAQGQEFSVSEDQIEVVSTVSVGLKGKLFPYADRAGRDQSGLVSGEGFDPASVYANSSTFTQYVLLNGGQVNGITRLVSDNLTLVGTPPYHIGQIFFVICNVNASQVSVRPKVRFFHNNAGAPGNFIVGFTYNPISVGSLNCAQLTSKLLPSQQFTLNTNDIWLSMSFDNAGGATATNTQMDSIAMAFFNPPDLGSSNDNFHLSTGTPDDFVSNNPAGTVQNFNSTGGPNPDPPDNFGWELRKRAKMATFTRNGTASQPPSSSVSWTVTLDTSDPADATQLTGLAPSHFALGTTGDATGTINSVVPNGGNNSWTVSATAGAGNGTLTLNLVNTSNLSTALGNNLPFSGAPFTIGTGSGSGAPGIVISQAYSGGGSGTAGTTYTHDYVELKNASTSPKSLFGLSLYYGSATGQFASSTSNAFALPNVTLNPGQHYLVQLSTPAGGAGVPVPSPDVVTTNLSMGGGSGKVALVAGLQQAVCGATATPCSLPHYQIVDLIAWGTANNAEGGTAVNNGTTLTTSQGMVRKGGGCVDTNNNNADIDVVTNPVPRNSTAPASACGLVTNTRTPNDFDGDGRTDYVVLRDSNGATAGGFIDWYISMNSNGAMHLFTWGIYDPETEDLAPADYDGDGKTDIAVWRRSDPYGVFHIILSSNFTLVSDPLGFPTDDPAPADYNGDGKADVAVMRQEAGGFTGWYYRPAFGANYEAIGHEGSGSKAGGDYNGDGIFDPAVFDEGATPQFRILLSGGGGMTTVTFGAVDDLVAPGDYDGDGKTDPAVIRNVGGFWRWIYRPSTGGQDVVDDWGIAPTDMPVPGDYNGDGKWDYAVWRPTAQGEFFVMTPVTRLIFTRPWGLTGDFPLGYGTHVNND